MHFAQHLSRYPYYPTQLCPAFVVAVSGGRGYRNRARVRACLTRVYTQRPIGSDFLLIQGNARGADRLARDWAEEMQLPFVSLPAQWNRYDRRAGPLRNTIIALWKPHLWVFFPGGPGTADAWREAKRYGIKRLRVL